MKPKLLTGKRVRLVAQDPEKHAALEAGRTKDTDYTRMVDTGPVMPPKVQEWRERFEAMPNARVYGFAVHTLAEDKPIGFVVLNRVTHHYGDAFVGIAMSDSEYLNQGYGSEAMQLVLDFGFQELNLHRVSLDTLATNARALCSYEKVGFVREGIRRRVVLRDGARTDGIVMGILRSEWETKQHDD